MFTPQLPGTLFMLAEERQRRSDLLRETERGRLVRKAKFRRRNVWDRVLIGIGDFLIAVGRRLQEQYGPRRLTTARHTSPGANPPLEAGCNGR